MAILLHGAMLILHVSECRLYILDVKHKPTCSMQQACLSCILSVVLCVETVPSNVTWLKCKTDVLAIALKYVFIQAGNDPTPANKCWPHFFNIVSPTSLATQRNPLWAMLAGCAIFMHINAHT